MFTRDKENMREYNYMNSIELLARDCSRDIQAVTELMGESYVSVVDYTMYSSRLGAWYKHLLEADKEFGAYDGHRDSIFRVIKLSDDLKQDVKAYQASCDKQAELLENYYFSNKNTADTKWLNIYNHKFSRDNRGVMINRDGCQRAYYVLANATGYAIAPIIPQRNVATDLRILDVVERAQCQCTSMAFCVATELDVIHTLIKVTYIGLVMGQGIGTRDHRLKLSET